MPIRQVKLKPASAKFVAAEVKAGRYRNENEVLQAAVDLLVRRQRVERKREYLRSLIQPAIDQLDRGEGMVFKTREELSDFIKATGQRARRALKKQVRKV